MLRSLPALGMPVLDLLQVLEQTTALVLVLVCNPGTAYQIGPLAGSLGYAGSAMLPAVLAVLAVLCWQCYAV